MADWKLKLKLWPEFEESDDEDPEPEVVQALARVIAARLNALPDLPGAAITMGVNTRRLILVQDFLSVADDPMADKDDFNRVMVWLYDWADTALPCADHVPFSQRPKVCWISVQEGM